MSTSVVSIWNGITNIRIQHAMELQLQAIPNEVEIPSPVSFRYLEKAVWSGRHTRPQSVTLRLTGLIDRLPWYSWGENAMKTEAFAYKSTVVSFSFPQSSPWPFIMDLLQRNLNGFCTRFHDVQTLIKYHNPATVTNPSASQVACVKQWSAW
jgi:hypothetical protein